MRTAAPAMLAAAALLLSVPAAASASHGRPSVAALQVALKAEGLYAGSIDGIRGPGTRRAIARFQMREGIGVDAVAGPRTRRALGRRGRPGIGTRPIRTGMRGWDVSALQFSLAEHGFPSGPIDGGFGPRSARALRRFQRWAGLAVDGVAGPGTLRALRRRVPRSVLRFLAPVGGPVGDRFGPRGVGLHSGLDYPVAAGTRVAAAGRGCVASAGWDAGGYGNLVVIRHRLGMTTWYAHLSTIAVRPGQCVVAGDRVGTVGATGHTTGPHLHFEMRLRGAVVDPLTGL
ncbi:MAG TPA: peptidoglycan-binding protein [Solirubrobacteraceae bacterium]